MKYRFIYLVLALVTLTSLTTAQVKEQFSESQINNLTEAIKSDNVGLQRSALYLAGYYKIDEVADVVKEQLYNDNPSVQILAAITLYEIMDGDALAELEILSSKTDENLRVRQMAKAIHDYWVKKGDKVVQTIR